MEKSLLNRKEKALPEERVSEVSGAGCVQRKAMEDSDSPRVQEKHHQVLKIYFSVCHVVPYYLRLCLDLEFVEGFCRDKKRRNSTSG